MLVIGATVRDHVWKTIKRLAKLLTKADSNEQLAIGIELGTNLFICSITTMKVSQIIVLVSAEGKK
jgi:hypothetical protein